MTKKNAQFTPKNQQNTPQYSPKSFTSGHKKTWNSTVVVPRDEVFALPLSQNRQREAHSENACIFMRQWKMQMVTSQQGMLQNIPKWTSIVVRFLTRHESCEVSSRQNKTPYKRLSYVRKNGQTERRMKIYFQLCRGAAHFRCLSKPTPKERHIPTAQACECKGNKKTSFRKQWNEVFW